jgi:hypothetical protein
MHVFTIPWVDRGHAGRAGARSEQSVHARWIHAIHDDSVNSER